MMSILFWLIALPFILIGGILGFVFKLTGKLLTISLGSIILILGIILCLTLIALPIGIVFCLLGAGMVFKGIF